MPQMMPLLWMMMMILLIIILLSTISFIYYLYLPTLYPTHSNQLKTSFSNWQWIW
uniref:ATP synthase F0 subunit 8 n=1 Tax=Monomorium pharaonis TaxID=307658 RepID=A0A7L8EYP4_MONPH|nr:ATP synthase F0 subunit 8 [Monomorium pharaonis]QOE17537.1 ATP synthase F0 subunit 8 [Monomorium pharaonis]